MPPRVACIINLLSLLSFQFSVAKERTHSPIHGKKVKLITIFFLVRISSSSKGKIIGSVEVLHVLYNPEIKKRE